MIAGKIFVRSPSSSESLTLIASLYLGTINGPLKRIETLHHRPERGLNILFPGG